MEAVLAEGLDIDENMLFLIYESSFAEEVLLEKKGLWDNIHAKRKRGEKAAKPGDKDYPETLDVDEGKMATARANVGANKCWDGYRAKGTKKKNGKVVPNCVKEDEKLENVISQMRDKKKLESVEEGRAEDAQASLAKVRARQKVLDDYENKTGKKLDIAKTPEHKSHKQNFPGAKRTGKKVPGAKETDLETHNRRVQTYIDRLKKHGKTTKQKSDDAAMAKHTSRFD